MKKKGLIILATVMLSIIIVISIIIVWYKISLKQPNKVNTENSKKVVEITAGTRTTEIVKALKQNNAIKSEMATKIYMTLHNIKKLQAGKYEFTGNETLPEVLDTITTGQILDETVKITFVEGKNMRYIASKIAETTNNTTNDVYKLLENEEYISQLINKYWFLTEDIQNTSIYYPLEGYLYPDTYTFENANVDVKTIFSKMLDQMEKVLSKNKQKISQSKYSIHQIVTIASIVEQEGKNLDNRTKIANVIYNRLDNNMAIGSDVTTYYAVKVDMGERDLYAKEINTFNAYNTRGPNMNGKLPIGPISNISEQSIEATLNASKEKYLYFVADKNGEIHFTNTYEEHQEIIEQLKKKGLWYEYNE